MEEDKAYIAKKPGAHGGGIPNHYRRREQDLRDYRNSWGLIQFGTMVLRALGVEKKKFR